MNNTKIESRRLLEDLSGSHDSPEASLLDNLGDELDTEARLDWAISSEYNLLPGGHLLCCRSAASPAAPKDIEP